MIQNRLNDKEKEIQGLKKQTSSLLNRAWEKGYVAGFDDGYETGRQAEERPTGRLIINYEAFVEDVENRLEHNRCPKEYAQGSRDALEVAKLFIWKEAENEHL